MSSLAPACTRIPTAFHAPRFAASCRGVLYDEDDDKLDIRYWFIRGNTLRTHVVDGLRIHIGPGIDQVLDGLNCIVLSGNVERSLLFPQQDALVCA